MRPLGDKLNQYLLEKRYMDILEIANDNLSQKQNLLATYSIALTHLEIQENKRLNGDIAKLKSFIDDLKDVGLQANIVKEFQTNYVKIDDKYFKKLKNNTYYQTKAILEKFQYSIHYNTLEENINSFIVILGRDPRPFVKEFSYLVIEFLKRHSVSHFSENDRKQFLNLLYLLANRNESDIKNRFFISTGEVINVRTGPGLKNSIIDKIGKDEVLLRLVVDDEQHTISNHVGNWVLVYIFSKDIKAWIFSYFVKRIQADPTYGNEYKFKPYDS